MSRGRTTTRRLRWAKRCACPPFAKPPEKPPKGAKARGLLYERRIVERLREHYAEAEVIHGPWIQYLDSRGKFYCQPDVVIIPNDTTKPIIVVEIKLTYKPEAATKVTKLYSRLISLLYPGRLIVPMQICRRRTARTPKGLPWISESDLWSDTLLKDFSQNVKRGSRKSIEDDFILPYVCCQIAS